MVNAEKNQDINFEYKHKKIFDDGIRYFQY